MSTHTPGPWKMSPYYTGGLHDPAAGYHILPNRLAEVFSNEANARLIAAAPDLLAELRNMVEVYWGEGDGHEPPPDCIQRARAAIAKAEGKS